MTAPAPVTVEDASALDELTYAWEAEAAPDASPSTGPTWMRATDGIDPRIPPCQYLTARRGPGELAALPMYVIDMPLTPDADPRSYFGGTPDTPAEQVCCGSRQASPAAQILASLPAGQVFPALLLGSMHGYKTEVLHSYWTPELAADLADAAVAYARDHGIKTIIAPWVADVGSGRALARELHHRQAVASFWALEHYLPLRHGTLEAHLAAGRNRDRYRYHQDMRAARETGITVRTLTTDEILASLDRMGTLAAATRRRYGNDIADADVPKAVTRLLELGVPLLCTGGFRDGQLVACCLSVEKAGRVYAKHAGFDYDTLGTRSGAYFAVVVYGTIAAAYNRNARVIEFGAGAHQAKTLRGCQPRDITSYLLTTQPDVRATFAAAAAANAPLRHAEYGS